MTNDFRAMMQSAKQEHEARVTAKDQKAAAEREAQCRKVEAGASFLTKHVLSILTEAKLALRGRFQAGNADHRPGDGSVWN